MLLLFIPLLTVLIRLCAATSLIISIPPSTHLPNPNTLSHSTQATLLGGSPSVPPLTAPITTRSTIEFHNLTISPSALRPQSYLLTISALSHVFASYRVDLVPGGSCDGGGVIEGIWETYPGSAWSEKGPILGGKAAQGGGASGSVANSASSSSGEPEHQEQIVTVEAKILARREFYEERAGFNPLGLLMNPMVLLGAVAMGITFGMPYLMDNIDPELKAEFEEQKKNSPLSGMHNALQAAAGGNAPSGMGASNFDLASWMAGTPKTQQEATSSGADVREGGTRRR